jgi:nitroreductase
VNSEYALLQLMILAEEKKLGTCISGYIAGYGKQITRFLRLDKGESVFCGIMIGYPAREFRAFVKRDDTVVTWVE